MVRFLLPAVFSAFPMLAAEPAIVDVRKIWDQAPHNAFTDLVRYKGNWYCTFREGSKHVSPDGKLRVITSKDGESWKSFVLIEKAGNDLRDPKIKVDPKGKLQVFGAAATESGHQSMVWSLPDLQGKEIGEKNFWLWNWTWNGKDGLGIAYKTRKEDRGIRLYGAPDYSVRVEDMKVEGYPNESQIRFKKDGTAIALLRKDPDNGLRGESQKPYKDWKWKDLGARIGGPNFVILPDGREIAVVRLHDGKTRTAVCEVRDGSIRELVPLPSSGDSSYAGMVWDGKILWVSYYSSHEAKTSIYLARVKL